MNKQSGSRRNNSPSRKSGRSKPDGFLKRRLGFESLEQRRLLSTVGLTSLSNVTLTAGSSVLVALNGSDAGNTVQFGVTSSNPSEVSPVLMPGTNKSVTFNVSGSGVSGSLTYQLFDNLTPNTASHIEALVNGGYYNGLYIYRAETGSFALIQGGNEVPTISNGTVTGFHQIKTTLPTGVAATINEEFNPDLSYTTPGDLAMARTSSPNTSGTEFFMTDAATSSLDYGYSLFGFQTQGGSVLQSLDALPTINDSGINYLTTPVQITSASVFSDTQNGVLMLRAPTGATGSFTVNVTAYDGTNTPTTRSFTVNVVAPTGSSPNPWASSTPAAPTSVVFQPQSGQGGSTYTSANNSSSSSKLQFQVSGTTSGNDVTIYANGVAIGSAVSTGGTTTVTTDGSTKLLDGPNVITATQTVPNVTEADSADSGTNETANVDSVLSPGISLQVATSLAVTSTPALSAQVGQAYTYTVQTNAPSGDAITVTPGTLPSGMTFSASTQTFTWTPTSSQSNTTSTFSASVSDALGHTATIGPVSISVGLAAQIPTNATLGGNVTVSFTGSQVEVYDNVAKAVLTRTTYKSTDIFTLDCPSGQANDVSVMLPYSASAVLPQELLVQGLLGSTNNLVAVVGNSATNTITLAGSTVTGNGLKTVIATVQNLALYGGAGNSYYTLNSSAVPLAVVDTAGYNTMDFSNDTAGVTVNLGLDKGQAQAIAPWSTTLAITGVVNKLIGSAHNDVLTGGRAATTEIVAGVGNDEITGGSGNNILIGGSGADTITGGAGKNLIIGGSGNSNLYAKGTANTIFAGTTNEDSDDQALLNLLNQGSRISYGYSARRLLASTSKNSSALSGPTVAFQDVGAHDTIFGSGVNDWIMAGKFGTVKP
jgi:cyclophilin family peptidyl-prolyl cis-trans isomerase